MRSTKQHDNVTVALLRPDVAPPPGSPTFTVYDDEYVILDLPHVPEILTDTVTVSLYRRLFDRIRRGVRRRTSTRSSTSTSTCTTSSLVRERD